GCGAGAGGTGAGGAGGVAVGVGRAAGALRAAGAVGRAGLPGQLRYRRPCWADAGGAGDADWATASSAGAAPRTAPTAIRTRLRMTCSPAKVIRTFEARTARLTAR